MRKSRLDKSLKKVIVSQIREFWPYYLVGVVALFLTHYIQSFLPFYAKRLGDLVLENRVIIPIWQLGIMAFGIIIFRTSSRLLFFYPARVVEKLLRVELIEKLEETPPSRYSSFSEGQLFQIIGNDFEQFRALIGFVFLQVGNIIVASVILIPRLFAFSKVLVLALIPLFVVFVIFTYLMSRNKEHFKKGQHFQGEVQNFLMESYIAKKTIKNFHSEKSFIDLFKSHTLLELECFYKAGIGIAYARTLIPFGVGISLITGAYIIQVNSLGASSLILFSGFIFLMMEPLIFVAWIGVVISRSIVSWDRIKKLVENISKKSASETRLLSMNYALPFMGEEFEAVVSFWDKRLSIPIKKGIWTILIGKTGCGKSVVINQLADILKMKGKRISVVSQTPYLYNDSLLNNIFLERVKTENLLDEAMDLLKLFGLDYLERDRERLFNLEIGENGRKLSGGQAKRLCLIRSIMEDSDIYLWDDPFSAIDIVKEREIISKLVSIRKIENKAFIITGHRVSTVKFSGQVIYLDKIEGILERGDSKLLLNSDSKTYEFFKNQLV